MSVFPATPCEICGGTPTRRYLNGTYCAAHSPGAMTRKLPQASGLIDPDCRDGKHQSCVGGPCECYCHDRG